MTMQPRRRSKSPAALARQWHLAATAVSNAVYRLGIALKDYDPNQPRVPAGQPGAGQWTDGRVQSAQQQDRTRRQRIVVAQYEKGRLIGETLSAFGPRLCIYEFKFGIVEVGAPRNRSCDPTPFSSAVTHGLLRRLPANDR